MVISSTIVLFQWSLFGDISLLINIEKWGKVDGFKTKRTDYQAPLYQGRSARRLFHYWYKFSTKSFLFQTFGYLQIWWEKRSFWSRDFLFWFWDLQLWCFGRRITYCGRKTSCLGFWSTVESFLGWIVPSFRSRACWADAYYRKWLILKLIDPSLLNHVLLDVLLSFTLVRLQKVRMWHLAICASPPWERGSAFYGKSTISRVCNVLLFLSGRQTLS